MLAKSYRTLTLITLGKHNDMTMDIRSKYLMRLISTSLFLMALIMVGCEKKEKDLVSHETAHLTFVEGVAQTGRGEPLVNLPVKLYYKEGNLLFSKMRLKAEGRTDKAGRYCLHFAVRDDERDAILFSHDKGHLPGRYTIEIETKGLGRDYILRDWYQEAPPEGYTLWSEDVSWMHDVDKTYRLDFFLPKKRLVKVLLKDFEPQLPEDSFALSHQLPAGFTILPKLPYTPYTYGDRVLGKQGDPVKEKVFEVSCALDQVNIFTLERVKAGVRTRTEHKLLITASTPDELTFVY